MTRPQDPPANAPDVPRETGRPMAPPIHWSAMYEFESADALADAVQNPSTAYSYGRYDNPTVIAFETEIAQLEGADRAVAFASGMAAITSTILALVPASGRVVRQEELYGGTSEFFEKWSDRIADDLVTIPALATDRFIEAITPGTSAVFLETPVNPTLGVVEIEPIAAAARAVGAVTLVDNTFATPVGQRPLRHGADVSLHSGTKFLGGHHDIVAGVVATSHNLARRIWDARRILGGILSPADAFLMHRGLRTLTVRYEAGARSALTLARKLRARPGVGRVHHPGLEDHGTHERARTQMESFGALLSFEAGPDRAAAARFLDALTLIHRVATLGGVETTVMIPADTSHASLTPEQRSAMGVADGLIRLSVGVEPVDDLWDDLMRGLEAAKG